MSGWTMRSILFGMCLKSLQNSLMRTKHLIQFPRKLELFLKDNHSPMEEWDESTQFGPANNENIAAISLITEVCGHAKKVHSSFPHVLYSTTPMGNEQWVKIFFLICVTCTTRGS